YDLFCKKSKPKEPCYQNKLAWYREQFEHGLRIKLLNVDEGKPRKVSRGFVEYIPAEYGWRAVNAPGYILIHCIWVVGRHKKKGYGAELIQKVIEEAKSQNKAGVIVLASTGHWAPSPKFLEKYGFTKVDEALPTFQLMVKKFAQAPDPSFPGDWDKRVKALGKGLTVVRTVQCPYLLDATDIVVNEAKNQGMKTKIVDLDSSKLVQEKSPSAYGVFNVVYNGHIVSYCWISKKDAPKILAETKEKYG
ncbi:GNAT family N-acetyltransferase, partial [candidate division WOR-3 bacterium]|nr:GNAT family N-acetyltransferase [candidate division WOR-3 bacterium]MBD3363939.1 GNAT family N-acetyltransferase [candidate division WOR-3 bacterium]